MKEYKLISSQEEYDKELKWFLNEMKEQSKIGKLRHIEESYKKFMETLDRAEGIGLFPKEYCDQKRKNIIDGMSNTDLKKKIKDKLRGFIK